MILAAGLGTRLKPWTDHHPKALAIVNGKSLLQRNIEYLQQYNITQVVVNVHHFAQQIIDAVQINNGWGSNVTISNEVDQVLETGGGLLFAKPFLEDAKDFVLLNADMLTTLNLQTMIDFHKIQNAIATLGVANRFSSRQLLFNSNNVLHGWQNNSTLEKKQPRVVSSTDTLHPFAFSGIHIIHQSIFSQLTLTGKFSMIDAYLQLCEKNTILGFEHSLDTILDVGKPESLLKAQELFI